MTQAMWEVQRDGEDITVTCHQTPTCHYCALPENGGERINMHGWSMRLQNFEVRPNSGVKDAHALDTTVWCPNCGSCEVFGVAITKDEYDGMKGVLNGQLARKSESVLEK